MFAPYAAFIFMPDITNVPLYPYSSTALKCIFMHKSGQILNIYSFFCIKP